MDGWVVWVYTCNNTEIKISSCHTMYKIKDVTNLNGCVGDVGSFTSLQCVHKAMVFQFTFFFSGG